MMSTLDVLAIDPTGETYGFVDRDKSRVTHVATGVIKFLLAELPLKPQLTICMFGDTLCQAFEKGELGVEEDHALRLPEEALKVPALVGLWDDGHLMLDGAYGAYGVYGGAAIWNSGPMSYLSTSGGNS